MPASQEPASQHSPPAQLACGLQVTLHACPLHAIGFVHDAAPEQFTLVVAARLVIAPAQAPAPEHWTLQD